MTLLLEAPAKINLLLRVLQKRPDGYHDVETVLHALALHDDVVVRLADRDIDLRVASRVAGGLDVPAGPDNLVCRAARSFFQAAKIESGCQIHLTKRIPAGGGLGGGSSDAAATLCLLNELTGEPLDRKELFHCAAALGADVPFFIDCGTQIGRGRGDQLVPLLDPPSLFVLLLFPSVGTSTAAVYKNHRPRLTPQKGVASIDSDKAPEHEEFAMPRGFPNHLESSALELYPELKNVRDRVADCGYGEVRLSGSGSTFFLAFDSADDCAAALSRLGSLQQQGVTLLQTESAPSRRPAPTEVVFPEPTSGCGGEGGAGEH